MSDPKVVGGEDPSQEDTQVDNNKHDADLANLLPYIQRYGSVSRQKTHKFGIGASPGGAFTKIIGESFKKLGIPLGDGKSAVTLFDGHPRNINRGVLNGMGQDAIVELQNKINEQYKDVQGFVPLVPDGKFGKKTFAAVELFLKSTPGPSPDPAVDPKLKPPVVDPNAAPDPSKGVEPGKVASSPAPKNPNDAPSAF